MIELPRALADALVRYARDGGSNEVCGVVALKGSRVVRLERAPNAAATPRVRFTFDDTGYRQVMAVERDGLEVGIFHSHPASPAYPSPTDRAEMSATWPGCLQLMVSLRDEQASGPELKAYRIDRDGTVAVEELRIVD